MEENLSSADNEPSESDKISNNKFENWKEREYLFFIAS